MKTRRPPFSSGKNIRQQGFALVLVLWTMSLLMIMAASFTLTMNREAAITIGIKHNAQAVAAAESGIALAEMMLLNPDQNKRWRTDGSIYQIQFMDTLVRIRMFAETGKIDINKADQNQLQSLMAHAHVETEEQTALVSAIMDWRDPDDLINVEGAEKEEYEDAKLKYQPRNKPFRSVEELQMVLGMNESILKWIEPIITVYSGSDQVDLSQASKEVLLTIPGLDAELIDQYIELRRKSAIEGVPVPPFSLGLKQTGFSGESNIVEIVSEALLEDGSTAIIKVVMAKNSNNPLSPFQILNWRREDKGNVSLFSEEMSSFLVTQHVEPK
ncbi:MAG: general secretion pathway protein GspK [Methylosarcina sp.]